MELEAKSKEKSNTSSSGIPVRLPAEVEVELLETTTTSSSSKKEELSSQSQSQLSSSDHTEKDQEKKIGMNMNMNQKEDENVIGTESKNVEEDVRDDSNDDDNNNDDNNDASNGKFVSSTSESSSNGENESSIYTNDEEKEEEEYDEVPFLKYGRIIGSLPRSASTESSPRQAGETNQDQSQNHTSTSTSTEKSLSIACKCSVMGRVTIRPSKSSDMTKAAASALGLSTPMEKQRPNYNATMTTTMSSTTSTALSQTFHILATAMEDGSIHLIDPRTGYHICPPNQLNIYSYTSSQNHKPDIAALCFDASGTYLAVITTDGDVAIFEFKFDVTTYNSNDGNGNTNANDRHDDGTTANGIGSGIQNRSGPPEPVQQKRPEMKAFDSFLSRLAGGDDWNTTTAAAATTTTTAANNIPTNAAINQNVDTSNQNSKHKLPSIPTLKLAQSISTARFSYKSSISSKTTTTKTTTKATCIALDPSYNRKREKCIIVGFSNGRLVHTRRSGHGGVVSDVTGLGGVMGSLLQPKRHDLDLFQGIGASGNAGGKIYDGIEAIAWRGDLVAWADEGGIKLFDINNMNRIAHIDRPKGARVSLYPGISSLKPTLHFEQSDSLLIAWGDCLMNMTIQKEMSKTTTTMNTKTRTVKCKMAWELDCVACGVVPVDANHVAVLGLVHAPQQQEYGVESMNNMSHNNMNIVSTTAEDEKNDGLVESSETTATENIIELQIICRSNGTVIQSDVLPLVRCFKASGSESGKDVKDSTSGYMFSSTFAAPRMDDVYEAEEEDLMNEDAADFDIQNAIMSTMNSSLYENNEIKTFVDPHMKWSIESYIEKIVNASNEDDDDDNDDSSLESGSSEDSDDYTFLFRKRKTFSSRANDLMLQVPSMIITSPHDAVLVQVSDVDDCIEHARRAGHHGLALRRAFDHRQLIRRHKLNQLIDKFLTAVFSPSTKEVDGRLSPLTVRRLKIACKATQTLLGGNVSLWARWSHEFSKIPGGLFLLRPYLPVRDPKLPRHLYEMILHKMFTELEQMLINPKNKEENVIQHEIQDNAIDLFLEALRAWGPISSLRERSKLHRQSLTESDDELKGSSQIRLFDEAKIALTVRMNQSARDYLQYKQDVEVDEAHDFSNDVNLPAGITFDSLFDLETLMPSFQARLGHVDDTSNRVYAIILEVLAELNFMTGAYTECLSYYLALATHRVSQPLNLIEDMAIASIINQDSDEISIDSLADERYKHVVTMIESHELHRFFLRKRKKDEKGSLTGTSVPPIVSLICLVGLETSGSFLIEYCNLAMSSKPSTPSAKQMDFSTHLPINQVAAQLEEYPKLLHWFLHRVFCEKPEIYVQFPNTAVPPSVVTDLHRIHFNLHIRYADRQNRGNKSLTVLPSLDEISHESPLMMFLKATMVHGGIRSDDVRKTIEKCRSDSDKPKRSNVKYPHLFAHELAYVIERTGSGSERDAREVLNLYLEGVVSLPLAVEYVERNTTHSAMLWEALVSYCLNTKVEEPSGGESGEDVVNGQLFGTLLEVAARSGADLAHLVSQIPPGMCIQGIRSKLVTAISDYRFKLKINKDALKILSSDKVTLMREQCYRSRRGVRIDLASDIERNSETPKLHISQKKNIEKIEQTPKDGIHRLSAKRKARLRKAKSKRGGFIGVALPQSLEIR